MGAADDTLDLMMLLAQAKHALETELTAALAEIGITPRTQCVLEKAMAGERTQSRLAELAVIDKTTMVVTMDALERDGLAERRPSSTDRRARVVAVTEAGAEKAVEGRRIIDAVFADVLGALPEGEREGLVAGLKRLVEGDGRLSAPVHTPSPIRRRVARPRP